MLMAEGNEMDSLCNYIIFIIFKSLSKTIPCAPPIALKDPM